LPVFAIAMTVAATTQYQPSPPNRYTKPSVSPNCINSTSKRSRAQRFFYPV